MTAYRDRLNNGDHDAGKTQPNATTTSKLGGLNTGTSKPKSTSSKSRSRK